MAILTAKELAFRYVSNPIITNAAFQLDDGDKIGIVGPNGAGKTTLLKLITGRLTPDEGEINLRRGTTIGYMEQDPSARGTVFTYCEENFSDIYETEKRMRELEHEMAENHSEEIMEEYSALQDLFAQQDGYSIKSFIRGVLNGLKIDGEADMTLLSGGERSKVAMARLLLRKVDILALDEPTNHLDIESVSWLENYLSDYRGTLIVVSHDRYFLDKICNKILNFEYGVAKMYKGGYKQAMDQIMEQKAAEQKAYEIQQKEIARQEDIIREFYSRATEKQIKKAKSRQKMLDKMDRIERPENVNPRFNLNLKTSGRGGNDVLMLHNIHKKYGAQDVLKGTNLEVYRGDKIGLIGGNGAGKTTLFRIALETEKPDAGDIRFGAKIETGYFAQNIESLSPEKTIIEEVHDAYPKLTISEVRGYLGAYMFKDDTDRKIKDISGGEKSRIKLLKLMMSPANLLLLDEPTNHLDTYSKEILDNAISNFDGSAVIISHDRFFLNTVCNKIALLKNGKIKIYHGNYDDYLEEIAKEKSLFNENSMNTQSAKYSNANNSLDKKSLPQIASGIDSRGDTSINNAQGTQKQNRKNWKKDPNAPKKKSKTTIQRIENRILEVEEKIAALEESLYTEEVYSDHQKYAEVEQEIKTLKAEAEELYEKLLD